MRRDALERLSKAELIELVLRLQRPEEEVVAVKMVDFGVEPEVATAQAALGGMRVWSAGLASPSMVGTSSAMGSSCM